MNPPSSVNFVFVPLLSLNQQLSSSFYVCLQIFFFFSSLCRLHSLCLSCFILFPICFCLSKPLLFSFPATSFISLSLLRSWLIDFIFILLAVVPAVINHEHCLLSSRHWSLYSRSQPITAERHYLLSLFLFCCSSCPVFCAVWLLFF